MRFGVLGPLSVWTADGEVVTVPEAKVRALLARLLVTPGRVVPADRLIEDLWPAGPPARPGSALQTLVSRLRKALAAGAGSGLVAHRPPGYLLDVAGEAVDSGRFTALAERARRAADPGDRAALFAEALGVWRGPAFADFADEPFVRAAVTGLEEERLLVVEDHAETRLRLGEYGRSAAELREWTDLHPLRERLHAARMRALYGAGRLGEALDVYQDLRRRLDEELGLAPGPELAALQQQILRRDPAVLPAAPAPPGPAECQDTAPRRRTNLPAPVGPLIGRSRAVAQVRALLATERLVTLTGPGGVGKTRLALETASGGAEAYADGVWLAELAGLPRSAWAETPAAVDTLAGTVAAALGVRDDVRPGPSPAHRPRPPADRLADALRDRRLLLVLDNCEHVVPAVAALARTLLRAAPGVRILATSREPLAIAGEQLWPVPPLDLPDPGADPEQVLESAAVRLFTARAAAASPGFTVRGDEAAVAATICRRVDGIPLALELAAGRVRFLGLAQLAERLDDRFGLLTGGRRDAPRRQQTLRAVIDWSWELLTAAEQAVLRRLAVHTDGCVLEAAETLCAGGGVKRAEVLDLLARLADRSLVVVQHDTDGPRYRLLESVSAYCWERLTAGVPHGTVDATTEYGRSRLAHARYYTALAEAADPHLRGAHQHRWLRRMDAEAGNFRLALDTAATTGDAPLARRLVRALTWYWFLRGRLTEAGRAMSTARAIEPAGRTGRPAGPEHTPLALWHTGVALLDGGSAGPGGDGPLRLYEGLHDPAERARPGWFLGYATTMFGSLDDGEELIRRALADFRHLGDDWGVAAALSVRGTQAYVRGDLAGSRHDAERSLTLFQETGDRWGQLQATVVLGRLAEIKGDYREAADRHRGGLRIAEELALWTDASVLWSELGRIALLTGDHARADELHERARRLAVEHGDRPAQESAEVGLALGARRQGRLDEAEAYLRPWLAWNRGFAAANGTALILAELGFIAELRGDAGQALALHRDGLAAARATGDPRAVALACEGLAGAHRLAGRPGLAARLLGTAARSRASVGAPLPPAERGDVDRIAAGAREALGPARYAAEFAKDADPE